MSDYMMPVVVEWNPGVMRDDGFCPVTVRFLAGGWQPRIEQTWEQPAEGGLFEDTEFVSAEIAVDDEPPLTDAEIQAVRAWFTSWPASETIQRAAEAARDKGWPDPDAVRDAAMDRTCCEWDEPF